MKTQYPYLMEHELEAIRLEKKTDGRHVKSQARWAGLKPGMRVADIGCGIGKTTYYLNQVVRPTGSVVGVDASLERLDYAAKRYLADGIEYVCRDVRKGLDSLGLFDFIWVRFVLEYWKSDALERVSHFRSMLRPGGVLCLIDLDYNCLTHYGIPKRLEQVLTEIMSILETDGDFDPYAGRKLYSYLYDLDFEQIQVSMQPHHLFFGKLKEKDAFNWRQKMLISIQRSGYDFSGYPRGFEGFVEDFEVAFSDPRRFTYTPMILCSGKKRS
jgi:SAM-dependent methyltransferase